MNKILSLGFFAFLMPLFAQEPTLAILKSVSSNTKQLFTMSNANFVCEAYGVIGIEKLAKNSKLNSSCKEKIENYYKKNPQEKYFSELRLHRMQRYHLNFKKKECVLFASGERTLGELLLRHGLAVLQANFKDEEYYGSYSLAQANAKIEKVGIYKSEIIRDCVAEIYK